MQSQHASQLISLALLALLALPVWAKDYVVDLVLLENLSAIGPTDYAETLYFPVTRNPVYLGSDNASQADYQPQTPHPRVAAIVNRLRASGRYDIIDHFAWRQPGLSKEKTRAINVAYGESVDLYLPGDAVGENGLIAAIAPGTSVDPNAVEVVQTSRLAGSVTLSLGRFLHVNTNLVLIRPDGTGSARLQAHRRMRSNEIHYLDHPRFGIIVLVTPVPDAPEPSEATEGLPIAPAT
jgi:hypothetical protein